MSHKAAKKKRRAGGGAFGKPQSRASSSPRLHGFSQPPRAAQWSELQEGKALTALLELEKMYPQGSLVKLGDEYAWEFSEGVYRNFASVNDEGMVQPHVAS
jgi:hypothetical protein